nr:hypothetical protein [Tanacetum cinerariifolium]
MSLKSEDKTRHSVSVKRTLFFLSHILTADGLTALILAALTVKGLAALTLGGEMLGLGKVCRMKGFLKESETQSSMMRALDVE